VEFPKRIKLTNDNTTVTAEFDVKGGGTGREFVKNILHDGEEAWNKWYQGKSKKSWIGFYFDGAVREIAAFAFKSANDYPSRDPEHVDIYAWMPGSKEKKQIGSFDLSFDARWETTDELEMDNF